MNNNLELDMEIIVNEYSNYVFKIINNIGTSLNYQDKEDIAADVFYLLWKYQSRINKNLKSYIGTITRNCTYDKLKRSNKNYDYDNEELCKYTYDFEKIIYIKEKINSLSDDEKVLFNLYYINGFKIKEISKKIKKNSNIIKVRLHRIRKKLKED